LVATEEGAAATVPLAIAVDCANAGAVASAMSPRETAAAKRFFFIGTVMVRGLRDVFISFHQIA
jgi:hypothetical protein